MKYAIEVCDQCKKEVRVKIVGNNVHSLMTSFNIATIQGNSKTYIAKGKSLYMLCDKCKEAAKKELEDFIVQSKYFKIDEGLF